jgi:hypothetical protein
MNEYDNNLRGALWKREQRHEKDMILSGDCEIDGKKYWMNVFRNTSSHDKAPTLDVLFKLKDDSVAQKPQKSENTEQFGEDIPF